MFFVDFCYSISPPLSIPKRYSYTENRRLCREREVFPIKEEMWTAIVECNSAYDGKFFYGVVTTGIFCRPSCKSKNPKKEHVRFFQSAEEALAAGFRPCKRCQPDQMLWPDEELIKKAVSLLESGYSSSLTLQQLASLLHISPYHLHRTFKRLVGCTPNEYIRKIRLDQTATLLVKTDWPVSKIADQVGFKNIAWFSTLFQKQYGMSPAEYRTKHALLADHHPSFA